MSAKAPIEFMAKSESFGPFNHLHNETTVEVSLYPRSWDDSEGRPVLIVPSGGEYQYVGALFAEFDIAGNFLGLDYQNEEKRSGAIASTETAVSLLSDYMGVPTIKPNVDVIQILDKLKNTSSVKDAFVYVGETKYTLKRQQRLFYETNLSRLVSDSAIWWARSHASTLGIDVDVAFKNVGGIRANITGPEIIRLAIKTTLQFNGKTVILELNMGQLLAAVENGCSDELSGMSRYPVLAGMVLVCDGSKPGIRAEETVEKPSRVKYLAIRRLRLDLEEEEILVEDYSVVDGAFDKTYTVATGDFLAAGGLEYDSFAAGTVLLEGEAGEQQILEDYIRIVLGGTVEIEEPLLDSRITRI